MIGKETTKRRELLIEASKFFRKREKILIVLTTRAKPPTVPHIIITEVEKATKKLKPIKWRLWRQEKFFQMSFAVFSI